MKIYNQQNLIQGYLRNLNVDFKNSSYRFDQNEKIENKLENITRRHQISRMNDPYVNWNSIGVITNAILTINKKNGLVNEKKFESILNFLAKVHCKHVVIYFSDYLSINKIETRLNKLPGYGIHSVLIMCQYHEDYFSDEFGAIVMGFSTNKKLIVLRSPFEKKFEDIMFFTKHDFQIKYEKQMSEFSANYKLVSESFMSHTYFNRKLFIGIDGEIKNAPECDENFGLIQNVKNTDDLEKIINSSRFKKYWKVRKDDTDVCKECEFRHMCVDNRVPIERTKNQWYHKIECNYNPYIAKWKGKEGYKTLEECGVISNKPGFTIDHDKIAKINANLWLEKESND